MKFDNFQLNFNDACTTCCAQSEYILIELEIIKALTVSVVTVNVISYNCKCIFVGCFNIRSPARGWTERKREQNCVNHCLNWYFIWNMNVIQHANCVQNKRNIFAVDYKLHIQMDKTVNLSSYDWKMESQTVRTSLGVIHDVTFCFISSERTERYVWWYDAVA